MPGSAPRPAPSSAASPPPWRLHAEEPRSRDAEDLAKLRAMGLVAVDAAKEKVLSVGHLLPSSYWFSVKDGVDFRQIDALFHLQEYVTNYGFHCEAA